MTDAILRDFSVCSFDVFDTLLFRTCGAPGNVFTALEKQSGRCGFARARIAAERKANRRATGRGGETTLEEIYSFIPIFKDLMEREIAAEKECLRGNPEMLALWREAGVLGKKRVIVSDMYLPQAFIEERLREYGIEGWDGFYLSRECNAKKSTGELFKVMLREMNVSPACVLHIGDNPNGDVRQANKVGIVAYQYCRDKVSALDNALCDSFAWRGILANGLPKFLSDNPDAGYWGKVGFILGGALGYAYARFVGESAKRLGIRRLLLVARDGYHLAPVFKMLYPQFEVVYIYAPRRLWREGAVDKEYVQYVQSLKIDDPANVAFVDLTTSRFSGLRLFEKALGHEVQAFNLLVYKPQIRHLPSRVHAMYHAHGSSVVFNILCEYLFTAPTSAVIGVKNCQPVYDKANSFYDRYKMGLCEKVQRGIVNAVLALKACNAQISASELIDGMEAFYAKATSRDRSEFSLAMEASGLRYDNWRPVLGGRECRPLIRLMGRTLLSYSFSVFHLKRYVTITLLGRLPCLKCRLQF